MATSAGQPTHLDGPDARGHDGACSDDVWTAACAEHRARNGVIVDALDIPPHGADCPCQPGEVGCNAHWRAYLRGVTAGHRSSGPLRLEQQNADLDPHAYRPADDSVLT